MKKLKLARENLLKNFLLNSITVFETRRDHEFYFMRIKKDIINFREMESFTEKNSLIQNIIKDLLVSFLSRYDVKSVSSILDSRMYFVSEEIKDINNIIEDINSLDLEILEYINGKRNFIRIKNIFNLIDCIE